MVYFSMYFLFFVNKFFKNLPYADICRIALEKEILISNCLKIYMKWANYLSLSFLDGTREYGRIFSTFYSFLFSIFSFFFSFSIFLSIVISPLSLSSSFFSLSLYTLPLLVVITLQCSFRCTSILVVKIFASFSSTIFANWPSCVSRLRIKAFVLLWFERDTCMNCWSVSSNFVCLSYKEGCCCCCLLDGLVIPC